MNKVLIAFIILWTLILIRAFRRGFIRSFLSFIAFIVLTGGLYFLVPLTNSVMAESENVQVWAQERCSDYIRSKTEKEREKAAESLEEGENADSLTAAAGLFLWQIAGSDAVVDAAAEKLSPVLIWVVSFIITALILMAAVIVFSILVRHRIRKMHFRGADRALGLIPGILKCLLLAWIVLLIIKAVNIFGIASELGEDIDSSLLLTFLYQKNPLFGLLNKVLQAFLTAG